MFLSVNFDCVKQSLYPTPVHITFMCLMTSKGVLSVVSGKKAVRAMRCYLQYCSSLLQSYEGSELDCLVEHIGYINSKLESSKFVSVCIDA